MSFNLNSGNSLFFIINKTKGIETKRNANSILIKTNIIPANTQSVQSSNKINAGLEVPNLNTLGNLFNQGFQKLGDNSQVNQVSAGDLQNQLLDAYKIKNGLK